MVIFVWLDENTLYLTNFPTDTDECVEQSSGCTQICNNTPGNYYCTCNVGYSLDADNHTCSG